MEEIERQDSDSIAARIIFDVLLGSDVRDIVLSPGSRNAPLLIAASARIELRKYIIADERQAGFFALGLAMANKRPAVLVCTSGTALYNYAPAIAEAYYQNIPLLVISADRPKQWIDQDDSQTLHQPEALGNIVKKSIDIPVVKSEIFDSPSANPSFESEMAWYVNRVVNEGVMLCTAGRPGPVHINVRLDNPLGKTRRYVKQVTRIIKYVTNSNGLPVNIMRSLAENVFASRILITTGSMPPDHKLVRAISSLSALPNVAVMCEPLSNLHLSDDCYNLDVVLSQLTEAECNSLRPDIVISIGGALVSRMLKDFLRHFPPAHHWTLADTAEGMDCFQSLTAHFDVNPTSFFNGLAASIRWHQRRNKISVPNYRSMWMEVRDKSQKRYLNMIDDSVWSDAKALHYVFRHIPSGDNLFLSNGTVVRYAQLAISSLPHAVYGCRGVSGIDGTNAAALGTAFAYKGNTYLVTGDISFSYCTEILGSPYRDQRLRIIIINNGGGAIFRFIDSTREVEVREDYFCAPPNLPVQGLCSAYGVLYHYADDVDSLAVSMQNLIDHGGVLEIQTPTEESADLLRKILSKDK